MVERALLCRAGGDCGGVYRLVTRFAARSGGGSVTPLEHPLSVLFQLPIEGVRPGPTGFVDDHGDLKKMGIRSPIAYQVKNIRSHGVSRLG